MKENIEITKDSTASNLIWRFLERCGAQIVTFIVSLVLARILGPEVYGVIAIVTVVNGILSVFIDSGLSSSLIQKLDSDSLDFATVFYFNFFISLIVYLLCFVSAPFIANFYNQPILKPVLRVACSVLIIYGVKSIQAAYVYKNLMFKKFFYATIIGTLVSAVLGIVSAIMGLGIWSLVIQILSNELIDTIVLWFTVRWRPTLQFSFSRLKKLLSFGGKLFFSNLIQRVYTNIVQLVIGKKYKPEDLAYYNRGNALPNILVGNIDSSINSVLFPIFSKFQGDKAKLKNVLIKAINISAFFIFPCIIGLFVCSDLLIEIILTEKWINCVSYVKIFCVYYLFFFLYSINTSLINSLGKSNVFLILEIIKKGVGIIVLIITSHINIMAMAIGEMFVALFSQFISAIPNHKYLDYGLFAQLYDIIKPLFLSFVMGLIVYAFSLIPIPIKILKLILEVSLGIFIYTIMSRLFLKEEFNYVKDYIKSKIRHNN